MFVFQSDNFCDTNEHLIIVKLKRKEKRFIIFHTHTHTYFRQFKYNGPGRMLYRISPAEIRYKR